MDAVRTQLLIRRARSRDRAAVDELFQQFAPALRRGLRRMLGEHYRRQHGDSADAAQDALLVAFGRLEHFEAQEGGSFLAWLLRIAELEMRQRLRGQRTAKRGGGAVQHLESNTHADPHATDATPSEVASGHELELRVRSCLEHMPSSEREVIELKRYIGLSTAEIREQLSLPTEGAVRALLSRAQTRLAELLDAAC